jgi:hypothetical protein
MKASAGWRQRSARPGGRLAGLRKLTTSHVERAFLTVRQELKRFQRKGFGYSKSLEIHKLAVALHFGVYNFVRHITASERRQPWPLALKKSRSLEQVVDMTEGYWRAKRDAK